MQRLLLFLLLLIATSGVVQAQFPSMPPCGNAFFFAPASPAGTLQYDQVVVPGLAAPAGVFTLEAWVRYQPAVGTSAWPDGFHTIVAFGEDNAGALPLLTVRYGTLELYNGNARVSGGTIPLDTWTHVAYVWDGTFSRLFVNGVQTATTANAPNAGGTNFYVGYSRGNTGWRGLIDEVAVWNAARTPEQIALDAAGGLDLAEAGLYGYYKFDTIYYNGMTGRGYARNELQDRPDGVLGNDGAHPTGMPELASVKTPAPSGAELISCMLQSPLGMARWIGNDDQEHLVIAESGTGRGDGRLTTAPYPDAESYGAPYATLYNLGSEASDEGAPSGTNGVAVDARGRLLIVQGPGMHEHAASVLVYESRQPHGPAFPHYDAVYDVGTFVLGEGYAETNPYAVAAGPGGDLFVVDAAANAIVRIDTTDGAMDVFATFPAVENPSPVGPPTTDAVPTGIAFDGTRFFVSTFTGFPFNPGASRLYTVALDGTVALYRDGLSNVIDVDIDPRDGMPVVVEFGQFDLAMGFLPNTGRVVKLYDGFADTLATGLTMPSAAMHFDGGTLFVTTLANELLRYQPGSTVDVEPEPTIPAGFALEGNYPNPFNPSTSVRYTLDAAQPIRLTAYDVLGREVAVLATGTQPAGTHTVTWDARGMTSGVYFLRLETHAGSATQRAVLLK